MENLKNYLQTYKFSFSRSRTHSIFVLFVVVLGLFAKDPEIYRCARRRTRTTPVQDLTSPEEPVHRT